MTINTTDIPMILATYVDTEIAPKAEGLQKFLAYALLYTAQRKTDAIISTYSEALKTAGVMPSDTTIDLDATYALTKFAMDKAKSISVMNYIMDSSDVEAIYNIAKSYAH